MYIYSLSLSHIYIDVQHIHTELERERERKKETCSCLYAYAHVQLAIITHTQHCMSVRVHLFTDTDTIHFHGVMGDGLCFHMLAHPCLCCSCGLAPPIHSMLVEDVEVYPLCHFGSPIPKYCRVGSPGTWIFVWKFSGKKRHLTAEDWWQNALAALFWSYAMSKRTRACQTRGACL